MFIVSKFKKILFIYLKRFYAEKSECVRLIKNRCQRVRLLFDVIIYIHIEYVDILLIREYTIVSIYSIFVNFEDH